MMETILNVGLNDESVEGLSRQTGNQRFAWDAYRRLIQMYGKTDLEIEGRVFSDALDDSKASQGIENDNELSIESLQNLVKRF
jgi:pyruvate,orthophosphate dikinase